MPFKRNNPGCSCCEVPVCSLGPSSWVELTETWTEIDAQLSGAGATIVSSNYSFSSQRVALELLASQPGQVIDIMLGCDESGAPDVYARLTFGNQAVSGDCGTIQLFNGDDVAFDIPQPVYFLCHNLVIDVVFCIDAELQKCFLRVDHSSGAGDVQGTISAAVEVNPSGRLGFRIQEDQSGYFSLVAITWQRLWVPSQTCVDCDICGTVIDSGGTGSTPVTSIRTPLVDGNTCIYTVGSVAFGGVDSVEAQTIISAFDRFRGYGIRAYCSSEISTTDSTSLEIFADNNHWSARVVLTATQSGNCTGQLPTTDYHMDGTLSIYKDGVLQDSDTFCVPLWTEDATPFEIQLILAFCDGDVIASVLVEVDFSAPLSNTSSSASLRIAGAQTGDGSAHKAVVGGYGNNSAGVTLFETSRCLSCDQCEECDQPHDDSRSWQVEIEATPSTYDGTYTLSGSVTSCGGTGSGGGANWALVVRRHNLFINSNVGVSGTSSVPVLNCDDMAGVIVPITGTVVGTATVTSL